jgi:amino acid efflux transporter
MLMADPHRLTKTLGLAPAIGLAITMVVGSGLLVLPGLAYAASGSAAIYAWLISALAAVPILVILARLGAELPDAGGIAAYVRAAFGWRLGAATEILILGTLPGGAAIIIAGGQYFAALIGAGEGSPWVAVGAAILLLAATGINLMGVRMTGKVQQWLAAGLVLLLAGAAALALLFGDRVGAGIAAPAQWAGGVPVVPLVFFAFVGWELMSFTSEEFADPARDFPRMIAASFVIVVLLYALVAIAVQMVLPAHDARVTATPIVALVDTVAGAASGRLVSALGYLIVGANLVGVALAFSRLTFASARAGLLPQGLSALRGVEGTPAVAIVTIAALCGAIAGAYLAGLVSHAALFELAGASFFLAYVLAALAYARRARSWPGKLFGWLAIVFLSVVFVAFGLRALYPLVVLAAGYLVARWRDGHRTA